jgi:excisionase family DNA binding protein
MTKLLAPTRSALAAGPDRAVRRHYVRISEAAEYLKVTERTIRQMIADGRLTGYRSGSRLVRLDLDEIDVVMANG